MAKDTKKKTFGQKLKDSFKGDRAKKRLKSHYANVAGGGTVGGSHSSQKGDPIRKIKVKPKAKPKAKPAVKSTRSSTPYKAPSSKVSKGVSTKRKPNKAAADMIGATKLGRPKLTATQKLRETLAAKKARAAEPGGRMGSNAKPKTKTYDGRGSTAGGPTTKRGRASASVQADRANGKSGYPLGLSNEKASKRAAHKALAKEGTLGNRVPTSKPKGAPANWNNMTGAQRAAWKRKNG